MSLTAKSSGGSDIPLLNRGWYNAVCCRIVDLGTQEIEWQGQTKQQQKVAIMFLIDGETVNIDGEQLPRCLTQEYTMSLHPKSRLRPHLENWRNKPFTEAEEAGFDIKRLLGVPAKIKVVQNEKGTWNNIDYIEPAEKKVVIPEDFESGIFEMPENGEIKPPEWVPNYLKKKIEESLESQRQRGLMNSQPSENGYDEYSDPNTGEAAFEEDEIPF